MQEEPGYLSIVTRLQTEWLKKQGITGGRRKRSPLFNVLMTVFHFACVLGFLFLFVTGVLIHICKLIEGLNFWLQGPLRLLFSG
jgi:hypothetical protein